MVSELDLKKKNDLKNDYPSLIVLEEATGDSF